MPSSRVRHQSFRHWSYVFDEYNVPVGAIDRIGVAACDNTGDVSGLVIAPKAEQAEKFAY